MQQASPVSWESGESGESWQSGESCPLRILRIIVDAV